MVPKSGQVLAAALCLAHALCFDSSVLAAANDPGELDGLWSGSWGHSIGPDGVVHQPVKAELFIQGEKVHWTGFPGVSKVAGTVRIDAAAGQIRATPETEGGQPAEAIVFGYEIKDGRLTLTDQSKRSIRFDKVRVDPLGRVKIEFLAATGINEAGELTVADFQVHRAGQPGTLDVAQTRQPVSTEEAAVFVVQEGGLKKTTLNEARRRIRGPTPVVIAFHADDRPSLPWYERWQPADSEAVARTLSQLLRSGTLVFVAPRRAKLAPPP